MKQIEMLIKIINCDITLINTYKIMYERLELNTVIFITPMHVKTMLNNYLNQSINSDELMMWTNFIAYTCINFIKTPHNDDEDFYCTMWDVLHCISSPVIHGGINIDTITKYLSELKKEYDI